jgi:hypothetical protein
MGTRFLHFPVPIETEEKRTFHAHLHDIAEYIERGRWTVRGICVQHLPGNGMCMTVVIQRSALYDLLFPQEDP